MRAQICRDAALLRLTSATTQDFSPIGNTKTVILLARSASEGSEAQDLNRSVLQKHPFVSNRS